MRKSGSSVDEGSSLWESAITEVQLTAEERGIWQQPHEWLEETVAKSDWPFKNDHNQLINEHKESERIEIDWMGEKSPLTYAKLHFNKDTYMSFGP